MIQFCFVIQIEKVHTAAVSQDLKSLVLIAEVSHEAAKETLFRAMTVSITTIYMCQVRKYHSEPDRVRYDGLSRCRNQFDLTLSLEIADICLVSPQ